MMDENEQLRAHVKELQDALSNLLYSQNFRSRAVREEWRREAQAVLEKSRRQHPYGKEN